ncbi:MAG: hypothetical protein V4726_13400 [Verrucomicrobiota bacterium]
MKNSRIQTLLGVVVSVVGLDQAAQAQFTTLEKWGDANNNPASFTAAGGTIAITAGGSDFYGASDNGVLLWGNPGTVTTGNFTATVRHVQTTTPAPQWGRDGLMIRATQSAGVLSANDAYWLSCRQSNGQFVINRRSAVGGNTYRATDVGVATVDYNSDTNDRATPVTDVSKIPLFLAAGRDGDRIYGGYAMDLGGGVAGRWVEHWSTDVPDAVGSLKGGSQVVVGLAHQSHPQTITPDTNDINTATFDNWSYSSSFNLDKFGLASGSGTWQVAGEVQGDGPTGEVRGKAYVNEGAATGEPVKWTVSVYPLSSFVPKFGTSGSRKDPTPMNPDLQVPPENFRQGGEGSPAGLTADIYLNPTTPADAGNKANLAANLAVMTAAGTTKTSTVIPSPFWGANNYPKNAEGENIFAKAFGDSGVFGGDQSFYGVEMKGQIFIPADAKRVQPNLPGEFLLFKDGTDDFCYLEIDGKSLINDNDWTEITSTQNAGGNITVMDVSDPKYNDGEWVTFRMIMWEGEGGDNVALYWDQNSPGVATQVFTQESVPGTFGNLVPKLGVENSRKDRTPMQAEDLVPASDFRHPVDGGGTQPGLKADIFLGGNPGNMDGVNTAVAGNPASTVILPNIYWYNSAGLVNYPPAGGGTDVFGAAGATVEIDATTGSNASGYSNYGVNMTGEIFIPAKGQRTALPVTGGDKLVLFKDGVDDFTYLEIDGQVLTRDNDWTGVTSGDNEGGHATLMDVSNPKFDDGEWVPFRMTTWEGGGGDSGALYWSARDTNGTFGISSVPGSTAPAFQATGTAQVGSDTQTGRFGTLKLPAGEWLTVLDIANTGTTLQRFSAVSVAAAPGATLSVTSFSFNPATSLLNLAFASEANSHYALEYTIGFQPAGNPPSAAKWTVVSSHADITGLAGTTAIIPLDVSTLVTPTGLPDTSKCFFRIRKL